MHYVHLLMFAINYIRGEDFRTAFKKIGGLRSLTDAPFMALSASAPSHVEKIIAESLCLSSPEIVSCDLNRANIYISASPILGLTVCL